MTRSLLDLQLWTNQWSADPLITNLTVEDWNYKYMMQWYAKIQCSDEEGGWQVQFGHLGQKAAAVVASSWTWRMEFIGFTIF